jgi:PAS domain S-box-containing protein
VHSLAAQQWRQCFGDEAPTDPRVREAFELVSSAYQVAEDEKQVVEHSLALSAIELEARLLAMKEDARRRELAEAERDAFFEGSPDLLGLIDASFQLVHCNAAWRRVLGLEKEQLSTQSFSRFLHPDDKERTEAARAALLRGDSVVDLETRYRDTQGRWHCFSWAVRPTGAGGFYCSARDVTEQRTLQRELAQSQKLEAVGQLAAGVAHEINTPMQFVGDNVHFVDDAFGEVLRWVEQARVLLGKPELTAADREGLQALERGADLDFLLTEVPRALVETRDGVRRVGELVKALKEFAHPDKPEMTSADLNQAMERTLVLARGALRHVAHLKTAFDDVPDVVCHVGLLNQVFLNLLVNAAHAIEDKQRRSGNGGMGHITVATRTDGPWVVVSVGDSGCGIPEAIRERIFEPFFTTKEVGRGSGQGLPLIRSIVVDRHGGKVAFETEPDVGTTFHVWLPIAGRMVEARQVA